MYSHRSPCSRFQANLIQSGKNLDGRVANQINRTLTFTAMTNRLFNMEGYSRKLLALRKFSPPDQK